MRMKKIGSAFVMVMAVSGVAALSIAQTAKKPQFEVASIRLSPNQSVGRTGLLYMLPGGRVTANGITLRGLIFEAYDLHSDSQLIGATDWMNTMRWDLDAQAAAGPGDAQILLMLRSLLEDKLSLKVHWDTHEVSADGLKLESSERPVEVLVIDSVRKPTEN